MENQEAQKIIEILLQSDGGCEYCVAEQLKLFCREFPEYIQAAREAFVRKFGKDLDAREQGE